MQTRQLLPDPIRGGESRETLRRQRDFFEHLFEQVVEAFPDPVGVVDGDGTVAGWNNALTELVGVDSETAVGRRAYEVVGTDDQSEALSETVARRGEPVVEDEPRTGESGDGELWAVRAKGFPLRGLNGDTVGAFQVNTVVTDVIRQNRALTDTQRAITEEVAAATGAVRDSLADTAADAAAVEETVGEQRRAVESIREELSTVANEARDVCDRADTVDETATALEEAVDAASDAVETAAESAETATQTGESVAALVDKLDEQASAVGSVAATIDEIADRTNLLALNANIEAARADGDGSDGFGVVAGEVKQLATRTQTEVETVRERVVAIDDTVDETVARIKDARRALAAVATDVETVEREQRRLQTVADEIVDQTAAVADSAARQADRLDDAREEVDAVVDRTAAVADRVDDVVAATDTQTRRVERLDETVDDLATRVDDTVDGG